MNEQLLVKKTMADMRGLSAAEINDLQTNLYTGLLLLGYYEQGDTPDPIVYYLSSTSYLDDGGSVIEIGLIKLEHDFQGVVDLSYYGLISEENYDQGAKISAVLNNEIFKKVIISKEYYSLGSILIEDRSNLIITGVGGLSKTKVAQGSNALLRIRRCINIEIIGLTFNGYSTLIYPDSDGKSAIYIDSGSENITIQENKIFTFGRDGVYVNDPTNLNEPKNINIFNNYISDIVRNGISIINGIDITITGNRIERFGLMGIDLEPNVTLTKISNVLISNNILTRKPVGGSNAAAIQAAMTGGDIPDPNLHRRVIIANNKIYENGFIPFNLTDASTASIRISGFSNSSVYGNIIIGSHTYQSIGISGDNISCYDNRFEQSVLTPKPPAVSGRIRCVGKNNKIFNNYLDICNSNGIFVQGDNHIVQGNTILNVGKYTADGTVSSLYSNGILVQGADGTIITNNIVKYNTTVNNTGYGIFLRNTGTNITINSLVYCNLIYNAVTSELAVSSMVDQLLILGNKEKIRDNASTSILGLVKKSSVVSDVLVPDATNGTSSTAADISGLVIDLNELISKFNIAVTELNSVKAQLNAKLEADRNSGQQQS